MVIFDTDRCIWKRDFGYDSLSIKEFDEYASVAITFVGYFIVKYENISVEVNRIERKFRIIVEHNDASNICDYGFSDFEGYYKNGLKHGFGKYISPKIKRIGMWRRDKFNGWGREIKKMEIYMKGNLLMDN